MPRITRQPPRPLWGWRDRRGVLVWVPDSTTGMGRCLSQDILCHRLLNAFVGDCCFHLGTHRVVQGTVVIRVSHPSPVPCRLGSWGNPSLPQLRENILLQPRHEKSATSQMLGRILVMASPTSQHCLARWKPGQATGGSDLAGKEPSHWAQPNVRCPPWPWQGKERAAAGSLLSLLVPGWRKLLASACWEPTRPSPLPAGSRPAVPAGFGR